MSGADRRSVTYSGVVVAHLRCGCGTWCRTDNRDVAGLTLARHLETEAP